MVKSQNGQAASRLLLITIGISVLLILWQLGSFLWDPYQVVRDVQNFYWMYRAQDAELFLRDYYYISRGDFIPVEVFGFEVLLYPLSIGYGLIFYLGTAFIDYVWLTKLTIWIIVPVTVYCLFKTGQRVADEQTGLTLSLFFIVVTLSSPLTLSIFSGLQRAFSLPLFVVFIYALMHKRYILTGATIVVSAAIYLPNAPPMILAYGLALLLAWRDESFQFRPVQTMAMSLVISVALALLFAGVAVAAQLGWIGPAPINPFETVDAPAPAIDAADIYTSEGAPLELFLVFPLWGRAGMFETATELLNLSILLTLSALIVGVLGRSAWRRIPRELWLLVIGGVIMYLVATFFVLALSSFAVYLPSRYMRTVSLAAIYFVGLNWNPFIHRLPVWIVRKRGQIVVFVVSLVLATGISAVFLPDPRLAWVMIAIVGLLLLGIALPFAVSGLVSLSRWQADNMWLKWGLVAGIALLVGWGGTVYTTSVGLKTSNPPPEERRLYEYIATLPKDIVIAGDSGVGTWLPPGAGVLTNIQLFSKRTVLFRELFPSTNAPIVDYFDAQYAPTTAPMLTFCQQYDVDYILLYMPVFTPEHLANKEFFFPPWNELIIERVAGRSEFALPTVPAEFTSGPYRLVRCDAETLQAGDTHAD